MFVINKKGYIDFYSQGYEVFNAEQFDNGTRSITLIPTNGSETLVFEPSKWTASIIYTKADGNVCFNGATINDDYSLTFELTEQMLAVAGKCIGQFFITNKTDGSVIRSTTFVVNVGEAIAVDDIESSSEMNALNALFEEISKEYEKIVGIIEKTDQIEYAYEKAIVANQQSSEALINANNAIDNATEAIELANSINSTAATSADNAEDSATLSESYAIGGTNTRDGENTDNSKYYSQQAQASKDQAQNMLTETQQILEEVNKKLVYTEFTINFETGQLEYNDLSAHNYEFTVNHDNGNLEWSVII